MGTALIVLEKDTVDEIETQLGRKPWAKGQHRIDEATGKLEYFDGTDWQPYKGRMLDHTDTLSPDAPVSGDIIGAFGGATPTWQRLSAGSEGFLLKIGGGVPGWDAGITSAAIIEATGINPVGITAVADNQAGLTNDSAGRNALGYEAVARVRSADNAAISWTFDIHDPAHAILPSGGAGTRTIQLPALGAGNIIEIQVYILGVDNIGPATGSYHLNTTALTLNGGTIQVLHRFLWTRMN